MLRIRTVDAGDARELLTNLRPADRAELEALGDPAELVQRSLQTPWAFAADARDGQMLVACWGWRETSLLGGAVLAWCLTTHAAQAHWLAFARESRRWTRWLLGRYDAVECWCHVPHARSLRWLAWLGFQAEEVVATDAGETFARMVLRHGRSG